MHGGGGMNRAYTLTDAGREACYGNPDPDLRDAARRLLDVGFTKKQAAALAAAGYRLLGWYRVEVSR
jgi:hypothetical protein